MKSLAIVLSSVLVAAGLLLVSPAAASLEPGDLTVVPQNPPHSGGGGTPAGSAAPRGGGSTGELTRPVFRGDYPAPDCAYARLGNHL